MSKKLPINTNPAIRTFAYHCFFHAIISTKDKVDTTVAKVKVKDYKKYTWKQQQDRLRYYFSDNEEFIFISNKWNIGMNQCFWRECHENDEIEIDIEHQLFSSSYGSINMFIASEDQVDMFADDANIYEFGNWCKDGIFIKDEHEFKRFKELNKYGTKNLLIRKCKNRVEAIFKCEDKEILLHSKDLNGEFQPKLRIGFEIKLKDNIFYEWYFSNYIEVCIAKKTNIMDFLYNNKKDWTVYQSNEFIDSSFVDRDWIPGTKDSILSFVKDCIDRNLYIEMFLNENFFCDIHKNDKEPYMHTNLIYGYDDENEVLNVLNMRNGIPLETAMKYVDFLNEENLRVWYERMIVTSYNPDYVTYHLDCKYLVYMLKKYLDSSDMGFSARHSFMTQECIWGISTLEYMLAEERINCVIDDIRISHLLFERARCMMDRIEYLGEKNILSVEEKDAIYPHVVEAYEITSVLRNMVLLSRVKGRRGIQYDIKERVKCQLEKLNICEREYLGMLIATLEKKIE